jgi:membrane-associated phospholipid phosphatase
MKLSTKSFYAFLIIWITYLIIVGVLLYQNTKGSWELWLNNQHNPLLDLFFLTVNLFGDGIFHSILIVVLLFHRFREALIALVCFIITSVAVQSLKRLVFTDAPRPRAFFSDIENQLYFALDKSHVYHHNSFPSGHSTTAFSVGLLFILLTNNRFLAILITLMAILSSWARVYLLQHFFVDAYFGSILGTLLTLVIYLAMNNPSVNHSAFLNRKLRLPLGKTLPRT